MVNVITVDGREFNARENLGEAVAFLPKQVKEIPTKEYGKKPALVADVVVLSGVNEGLYYDDALIFQTALVSQGEKALKSDDKAVIGTLGERTTQDGENTYFVIEEASSVELRLAAKYGV